MKRMAWAAVLTLALTLPARADLESGMASFERGDFAGAVQQLRPLAEQGNANAQYLVGLMYLNGYVDPPSADAAATFIERAAEQNHLEAQTELARMYRTGDGVAQDAEKMAKWYRRAAEQGDVGAQLLLADTYAYGYGIPRDYVQAYMWYEIAIQYWGPLAVRARDVIGEQMPAEDVAKAVKLAGEWLKARPK